MMSKTKTVLIVLAAATAGALAGFYARQVADTYDTATRESREQA